MKAGVSGNSGSDCDAGTCHASDLAGNIRSLLFVWGLPFAAFVAGYSANSWGRAALWAGALVVAGGACLVNAKRCGRTHCYFTGPYFLLCALAVVLAQLGIVPIDASNWYWLGIAGSAPTAQIDDGCRRSSRAVQFWMTYWEKLVEKLPH